MESTSKARLQSELKVWEGHAKLASDNISRINAELKAATIPLAPPAGTALMVEVQFAHNPNTYKFLIVSVSGKGYYTTGTLATNSYFSTWVELWDYFNSEDVVRRSAFAVLLESPFSGGRYGEALDRRAEF